MVLGAEDPQCFKCKANSSCIWQRGENKEVLCNDCYKSSFPKLSDGSAAQNNDKEKDITMTDAESEDKKEQDNKAVKEDGDENDFDRDKESGKSSDKKESKRKTRKGRQGGKGSVPKGKGRRYIFKKSATKAPVAVSTPVTSEYLFYQGTYYQVGDIVSVVDIEGGTYYAQIRGLLQDQYCEKSAVLTWILPSKHSPPPEKCFDPSTYIIGPEEDIPRKLEYLQFVCHAPSDYFKDQSSPYSTISFKPQSCYVWSKFGPVIKSIESAKELMNK